MECVREEPQSLDQNDVAIILSSKESGNDVKHITYIQSVLAKIMDIVKMTSLCSEYQNDIKKHNCVPTPAACVIFI